MGRDLIVFYCTLKILLNVYESCIGSEYILNTVLWSASVKLNYRYFIAAYKEYLVLIPLIK